MARVYGNRPGPHFFPINTRPTPKTKMVQSFLLAATAALAGCQKGEGIIGPSRPRYQLPDAATLEPALIAEQSQLVLFIDQHIPPAQQALAQSIKERLNSIVQTIVAIDNGVILPFNALSYQDEWYKNPEFVLPYFRSEFARSVEWIGLRFDDPLRPPFEITPNLTEGSLPPALRQAIFTFANTQHQASLDFLEKDPATDVVRPVTEQTQIRDVFRVVCIRLGSTIRSSPLFE